MPDIFGKEPQNYSHILDLMKAGVWEEQQRARTRELGWPDHDFRALGSLQHLAAAGISRDEQNAQAFGYLTNNLQAIHSVRDEILYTDLRLPEFITIISDVPEGAKTYAYRVTDRAGRGQFIENDGTSAPSANVSQRLVPYELRYAGIVPQWTMEDLRNAMLTGMALDADTVEAGMQGALNHIEEFALVGDDTLGVKGLVNLPTTGAGKVTLVNTNVPDFLASTTTAEQIRAFITSQIGQVIKDTAEVFGRTVRSGLCVYLPIEQFNKVTSFPFGDNSDRSIWDYIEMYNPWTRYTGETPMLKAVQELDDAGGTANAKLDRMIIAVNSNRVWEMAIPIFPRILTTINYGYVITAPMEYKMSALNIKRPTTIRYCDGVGPANP